MPIDAHTLAQHPWMKYINQEELLKPVPYDGYPKHKLRKMLVEKDEFIKDIMDNIEDHPDYDDTIMNTWQDAREEIEGQHKHIRKINRNQAERIGKLEKKVNSQMRVAKSVNAKLQKQIRTMKDDWYDATNKLAEQNNQLRREIVSLKESLKECGKFPRGDAPKEWMPKLPDHNEDKIKQQKQLIDYYELREDYFEKFIEEWESGSHEWREFCEARAHKTGNEEHVGILFDD